MKRYFKLLNQSRSFASDGIVFSLFVYLFYIQAYLVILGIAFFYLISAPLALYFGRKTIAAEIKRASKEYD